MIEQSILDGLRLYAESYMHEEVLMLLDAYEMMLHDLVTTEGLYAADKPFPNELPDIFQIRHEYLRGDNNDSQ